MLSFYEVGYLPFSEGKICPAQTSFDLEAVLWQKNQKGNRSPQPKR